MKKSENEILVAIEAADGQITARTSLFIPHLLVGTTKRNVLPDLRCGTGCTWRFAKQYRNFFHQSTLPFFTKPLAHLGNRSPKIDTAEKIAIVPSKLSFKIISIFKELYYICHSWHTQQLFGKF
ncbi:MAG: hypothetical protein K8R58_00230 [Bacteroidales bacterium]|nr:hypothetical protein [Bacteroidales bacterium]